MMRAYVLSIGSELILGHLTDSNAIFLAQELTSLGIELLHVTQVGDDRERLSRTLRRAAEEADLVVCTGGIGPTEDDLTREAIADVVGETPAIDPDLVSSIERIFAARGQPMPERNKKQAWLIPSSDPLTNPVGTAPGWFVRHGQSIIVSMPGVPREMTRMWREQVVPRIQDRLPARVIRSETYKTVGIGESAAEQILGDLVLQTNPVVATYAKDDGVHVRVTGVAATETEASRLRDTAAAEVQRRLSEFIYGTEESTLASALLHLAAERDWTLAVVDEGGGGRLVSLLSDCHLASSLLSISIVRPRGAAPAVELAREAAAEARVGVGIAVSTTPAENGLLDAAIDVGLAGALSATERFTVRSSLTEVHRRTAMSAADVLRRALVHAT